MRHSQLQQAFTATTAFIKPNVSICTTEGDVHYNPLPETKVVAKFNVTSTSSPTNIAHSTTNFSSIEIDGKEQPSVVSAYTFSTTGEHTVKYKLNAQKTIDYYAFAGCSSLTSIAIPNSVTTIGNYAFFYCDGLTSIDIPDSVTSIGGNVFAGCSGLTSCTIGSGVTSISYDAFSSCSSLTRLNSDVDGVFNIPSGVTGIGDGAFSSCSSLTSIVIPDSVTSSIGKGTFSGCTSLTSCTIGSGVTSIGTQAFYNCYGLTSIVIPDSVTSIGNNAFSICSGLTSCTIGSGVTSIGGAAFTSCSSLTRLNSDVDGVFNIPSGVTSIGSSVFARCSGLTSMTVDSNNTVYDSRNSCNGIINTSTNTLIAGCKNTVIPNSVTIIGDYAFYGCSGLTSITSNATTAPTIQSNTFQNVKTGGTLTVPSGSSGYNVWMGTSNYYLGKINWTKVEQ